MSRPSLTRPSPPHSSPRRPLALPVLLVVTLAAALCTFLHAQSAATITVLMLDGKTGKPIVPSNFIVRLDHLNAVHNEMLKLGDDGIGTITVPPGASFLSIQGTYNGSTDIYINCDAGMEKDTHALHWYAVPEILSTGVVAPNECYKGKYADATHTDPKPGQFVLFVRANNWREAGSDQ